MKKFLLIFLISFNVFANSKVSEKLVIKKVLSSGDSFIGVRPNGEEWLINQGYGCFSINSFNEGKWVIAQYFNSLSNYDSKIINTETGQECKLSKAEKISDGTMASQYTHQSPLNSSSQSGSGVSSDMILGLAVVGAAVGVANSINDNSKFYNYIDPWRFGIGLNYPLENQMKGVGSSKNTGIGGTSYDYQNTEDNISKSFQLSLNIRKLNSHSSGFLGSMDLKLDYQDELDYLTFSSKIFKANYAYRANSFYGYIGPNLSTHTISYNKKMNAGVSLSADVSGGLGLQFGFGQVFNEHVSLELEYQLIKLMSDLKFSSSSSTSKVNFDTYVNSIIFGFKIYF